MNGPRWAAGMIGRRWAAGRPLRAVALSSIRHRTGQVVALAVTLALSSAIVAACTTLIQTGISSVVSTGELSSAPVLLAPDQDVHGESDTFALPGRPSIDPDAVTALRALRPDAVVADRQVPATATTDDRSRTLVLHPADAMRLAGATVNDGATTRREGDIVLDSRTASRLRVGPGDTVRVGWGGRPVELTVSGTFRAPASDLASSSGYLLASRFDRLFPQVRPVLIGVWPGDADTGRIAAVADHHGLRTWGGHDRGRLEVVSQGTAKQTIVEMGGAFAGIAVVVALFVITVLVSLQVRQRSRELSLLRIVGATPAQAKGVLLSEIRMTSLAAGLVGAVVGPFAGSGVVALTRWSGLAPDGLEAVNGTLPSLAGLATALLMSEIAARFALRRIVKGSPVAVERVQHSMSVTRVLIGLVFVAGGVAMAIAPLYLSGEAAVALPAVSGLVIVIGVACLGPLVMRVVLALCRGLFPNRSAPRFLAYRGLRARPAAMSSAAVPVVLGVSIACTQLFVGTTTGKVADLETASGQRGDFSVVNTTSGVSPGIIASIARIDGVRAVQPVVQSQVVARCECSEPATQAVSAYGVAASTPVRFADLRPRNGVAAISVGQGQVAIGRNTSGELTSPVGSTLRVTLPDGRTVHRKVVAEYTRDTGFAGLVLPMSDVVGVHPTGYATGAVIFADRDRPPSLVRDAVARAVAGQPGTSVRDSPVVPATGSAPDESIVQLALLLMLFGYIAIAVVNSLVMATLGRADEIRTLNLIGATPRQLRSMITAEAVFVAASGVVLGSLVTAPGLISTAWALSDGATAVPGVPPVTYAVIVVLAFGVVLTALRTSLARTVPRVFGSGRRWPRIASELP